MSKVSVDEDIRPLSEFRAGVASFVKHVHETGEVGKFGDGKFGNSVLNLSTFGQCKTWPSCLAAGGGEAMIRVAAQ